MTTSIVFLLGAGFSSPFGVPTMYPFLESFRETAKRKYPQLCGTLDQHFQRLDEESDLEALLSSLGKAERLLDAVPPDCSPPKEYEEWHKQSIYLKSNLISYIIERCERFDANLAVTVLVPAMRRLCTSPTVADIHLFTTNYDRIIEYICEAAEIDYADGFGSTDRELVAPWNRRYEEKKVRIYKLHGSVTYYVDQKKGSPQTFLRLDRGYPLPGPDFRLSREGKELEPLMVLPTLEKDALGDPYAHLNQLFTETMARTHLVVAVGTSLRDNHLVSAMNYNVDRVVVLIVDTDPTHAMDRIPNVTTVPLRADSRAFFERSIERLISATQGINHERSRDEVQRVVEEFASNEVDALSRVASLTDSQQEALNCIVESNSEKELLGALQKVRGITEEKVIEAVGARTALECPAEIRKAATSCLGLCASTSGINILSRVAREDSASDVRLEAYLALRALGTRSSLDALASARERWPQDAYFSN